MASGGEYPPTPVGVAEGVGGTAARSRLKAAQLNDCALPATEWVLTKMWPADFDIWRRLCVVILVAVPWSYCG